MELQKFCDNRAMSGYKSALLYKEANESLYHLLLPLETVPTVSGSTDTFDFDLLTCPSKGQIEGKESLDQVDVDFLWHRDNVARLEALQGKVLDFMAVYQDFTGRAFTGTIKVRPQEAGADIMRGTFTITPMSASTTTLPDARDMIKDTIVFTNQIPASIVMDKTTTEVTISTNPSNTDTETYVTISAECSATYKDGNVEKDLYTLTPKTGEKDKYTIEYKGTETTKENNAILTITVKPVAGKEEEFAGWSTSIALSTKIKAVQG